VVLVWILTIFGHFLLLAFKVVKIHTKEKRIECIYTEMAANKKNELRSSALDVFRKNGGVLKTTEAIDKGIHHRILYELEQSGELEKIQRGLFCLKSLPDQPYPDFAIVAKVVPKAVICLISALSFHGLTTQVPHYVHVAVPQGTTVPKINYPPIKAYKFSEKTFFQGIEFHDFSGAKVAIFSPEKSIVDSFKHRSKVGLDVAVEALKVYICKFDTDFGTLISLAKNSKVDKLMRPYIEAFTSE
jgi:predicted transcriptional regulator of viral defense system